MIRNLFILLFTGAGLIACSSVREIHVHDELVNVQGDDPGLNSIDSLVMPYRDSLEDEMNIVIAHTDIALEKGRPNGNLNNWTADVLLAHFNNELNAPVISLLNVGGLRNTINKGDITIGDIFKVMPFDNEVVIVTMDIGSLTEIGNYIAKSGGEPISGCKLEGKTLILNKNAETDYFYIITSDYLMNGGDHMDFFQKRLAGKYTGILLRDVFIDAAKAQVQLIINDDERINLGDE